MAHIVELSDDTFTRLQKLATPLVDTVETIIIEGCKLLEERRAIGQTALPTQLPGAGPRQFSAASPPNLTHTKVLSIKLEGTPLPHATWNGLLFEIVRRAKPRLQNADDARRLIIVNFVPGKKDDEGYRFIPEVGLSVQGQDANAAWRGASHIAQQIGLRVEAEFVWRTKNGAEFPGVTGRLSI
jgi:hypothetical protein